MAMARPGTWWTGAERVAMIREVRRAHDCALCRTRRDALSPYTVEGDHQSTEWLPAPAVDVIHRVVTDPGRLSKTWFGSLGEQGLDDARYAELLAVTARVTAIDVFCRTLGIPLHPPPEPEPGEPSRRRPAEAAYDGAWIPTLAVGKGPEELVRIQEGLRFVPNVLRAVSLVPQEVLANIPMVSAQYMPPHEIENIRWRRGRLERMQVELVATRAAAQSECFY